MDPLKLVSTIVDNSTFGHTGHTGHDISIEDEGGIQDLYETDRDSKGSSGKRKSKKISVLHPPDGGKLAWKMVAVCFILNICKEVQRNLIKHSDGFADDLGIELARDIRIIYEGFSKFGGVFAAMYIFKYRNCTILAITGGVLAAGATLLASLLPPSLSGLIAFLVSCISGIGCGFLEYVILVVSLEYFVTKRVKALIIINIGTAFADATFTTFLEVKKIHPELVLPWTHAFRYQAIGMAVAVVAGGFIRTLDLEPEPEVKKLYRYHHFQYSDFAPKDFNGLLKDMTVYLYMVFFLLYDYAEHLPNVYDITDNQKWAFDSDQLLASRFIPYMGFACAALVMCFWKNQTFSNMLAVLGPINFIMGLCTCVILPYTDFGLVVFYGIIFVVCKHCILWMMLDVIPDEFGRNNTRICLGVICFIAGSCEVASAYSKESAESYIDEPTEKFKAVFILSGALIMVSGLFAIFIRCLIVLYKDPETRKLRDD